MNVDHGYALVAWPYSEPDLEHLVHFIYGPDEEDTVVALKTLVMEFSPILKGMLLADPSKRIMELQLKYPSTFKKYCVPLLIEKEGNGTNAAQSIVEMWQKESVSDRQNLSDLCYLFQMTECLCLEEVKAQLRKILAEELVMIMDAEAFCPENISKAELYQIFVAYSDFEQSNCNEPNERVVVRVILYWLRHESTETCGAMKIWLEQKFNCSFAEVMLSAYSKDDFKDIQATYDAVLDKTLTASEILSVSVYAEADRWEEMDARTPINLNNFCSMKNSSTIRAIQAAFGLLAFGCIVAGFGGSGYEVFGLSVTIPYGSNFNFLIFVNAFTWLVATALCVTTSTGVSQIQTIQLNAITPVVDFVALSLLLAGGFAGASSRYFSLSYCGTGWINCTAIRCGIVFTFMGSVFFILTFAMGLEIWMNTLSISHIFTKQRMEKYLRQMEALMVYLRQAIRALLE